MNIQIIRRPGGAWEKHPDGGKGRQLWKNVAGRRTLMAFGREWLVDWQDLIMHIPILEYKFENKFYDYNPNMKNI